MNGCKYYKQEEQVSYDNKQTWESTGNYRKGELYESYSSDCPEYQRWKLVPGGFICEDGSKYQKLISEISDDGVNYKIKYPAEYSAGTLIETDAIECNYKWYGHYYVPNIKIDPIKVLLCNSNSDVLTSDDVAYGGYLAMSGYVGSCVTGINFVFSSSTLNQINAIDMSNSNIETIPDYCFKCCQDLETAYFPNGLTSLGTGTFSGCTILKYCTIGNNITSIEDDTFNGCWYLNRVNSDVDGVYNIPSGVTSIGENAFHNVFGSANPILNLPSGLTTICDYAFNYSGFRNITIPSGVTTIGDYAFFDCTNLENVDIGGGSIGEYAFAILNAYNPRLSSVTIGDNVNSIGSYAFSGNSGLTNITIGSGVTYMGDDVFTTCVNLPVTNGIKYADTCASKVVDNTLSAYTLKNSTKFLDKTFYGCENLTNITIPSGVISIGAGTFYGCKNLTSINIPSGVTRIGANAFQNCSGLTSVDIPSGVTSIADNTFYGCTGLASVNIPDGVTSIGNYAFWSCNSLTNITIPNNVTSIGGFAFQLCQGLTNVVIGNGITSIGSGAFMWCGTIDSTTIYATTPPTLDGNNVFYGTGGPIYVPAESVNDYKSAYYWSEYSSRIQAIPT